MPRKRQSQIEGTSEWNERRRQSAVSYEQFQKFLSGVADDDDDKTKIAIVYYSLYGHIASLAESVKKGVEAGGATCDVYRVEETLPDDILKKMGAPPKADHPVITADKMPEYDGVIFGISGRFGAMSAQMKAFMDSCGGLWQRGSLVGKAAGTFVSVGTLGGGQETVHVSMISFFTHMGMAFVPLGYIDPKVFSFEEIHGATAYGSGTYAKPDGSRMPSELEKGVAETHGKHFAGIAGKLAAADDGAAAPEPEVKAAASEARRASVISYEAFKEFLEEDDKEEDEGKAKIAIVYYSLYGHIAALAESVKKGVEASGAACAVYQVEETLNDEILKKMGAPPKQDHPIITAAKMKDYDGVIFGISGRFGAMSAQMKAFMDSCGSLWQKGSLVGKSAGSFVSVGTLGGGQETVHVSMVSFFAHMGMAFVPLGYIDSKVFSFEEIHGATAYGSGTYAGPRGDRMPSELEKGVAETHGKHFGDITAKLAEVEKKPAPKPKALVKTDKASEARRASVISYEQFEEFLYSVEEEDAKEEPVGDAAVAPADAADTAEVAATVDAVATADAKVKIAIVYYSLYGHIAAMAQSVKEGVEAGGAACDIYRVEETLTEDILTKMGAPPKADHPVITPPKLTDYDGVIFGISGRFGAMSAQMKAFMDSCGGLWMKGSLVGKAAGTFVSVGTLGGGQETVHVSMISFFTHMGMAFVPLGYVDPAVFSFDEIHGATAYGSGTYAKPDGSRMPSDLEKGVAKTHGKHFAGITTKLAADDDTAVEEAATEDETAAVAEESKEVVPKEEAVLAATPTLKIAIIYYSLYGHIATMAESVKEGLEAGGATCDIYRVEETLPEEILAKMGAPPKADHPVITTDKMTEYDGFIFGISGRFGAMSAQMKAFMDACGGHWQKGSLVGKPAGTFVSVGTLGGGQETVHVSMISFFTHMGMPFVPLGYTDPAVFSFDEIHGATAYGCGTYAKPDGSRMPSDLEKGVAKSHGKHFAGIAAKLSA